MNSSLKKYIFVHGHNSMLSRAEIECRFSDSLEYQNDQISIVSLDEKPNKTLQNSLGGTVKIAEIFYFFKSESEKKDIISPESIPFLEELLEKINNNKPGKVLFGMSCYGCPLEKKALITIKKLLQKQGVSTRFINKEGQNISSGQLNKTEVLDKGFELIKVEYNNYQLWAKTLSFQDIDSYSKRDYKKPHRNMRVGMMPPKLTQMMINMSQAPKNSIIYDPFCGLGTTLIEARLMGFNILGSDIKGRLVHSSLENVKWAEKEFNIFYNGLDTSLNIERCFQHDVTQILSQKYKDFLINNITSIVTESYLGPAMESCPNEDKRKEIFKNLNQINSAFLNNAAEYIKERMRIVMCFPFYKKKNEKYFYPEENILKFEKIGLEVISPLRKFIYERDQQIVGREIIIFEKK